MLEINTDPTEDKEPDFPRGIGAWEVDPQISEVQRPDEAGTEQPQDATTTN